MKKKRKEDEERSQGEMRAQDATREEAGRGEEIQVDQCKDI